MKNPRPPGSMWQLYKMGGIAPALTSMFNQQSAQQMAYIRSIAKEQRQNSLFDIRLDEMESVVFDLETTGFSPSKGDEIISVGAVLLAGSRRVADEIFYSPIQPKGTIPLHIEQLTGLTNREAAKAPELVSVLSDFLTFAGSRTLIVHGSGHDKMFLNSALWKTSKIRLTHRMLDTMMVAKWLRPKTERFDLDTLLGMYGVEVTTRHHALQDAVMTADLWCSMLQEIRNRGIATLGDLYTQLSRY
jgi:DNA polymerase III subunit epsilon